MQFVADTKSCYAAGVGNSKGPLPPVDRAAIEPSQSILILLRHLFSYTHKKKHQRQVYRPQFNQSPDNAGCPHEVACRKTHVQLVAEAASNAYNGTSK